MSDTQWKWQEPYIEAFLDTNPVTLVGRVAAAENAICLRTKELRTSSDERLEWQAITDAVSGLSILKREIKSRIEIRTEQRLEFGKVGVRAS